MSQRDGCIHSFIERRAFETPNVIALVEGTQAITFHELNGQANQVAASLTRVGVGPEILVGLYLERSVAAAVGLLGILKAGGAYVPLDPSYPAQRVDDMLADSRLKVVVTRVALRNLLSGVEIICVDEIEKTPTAVDEVLNVSIGTKNAAFVIFTSGSTGRPKGTIVIHSSLMNRLSSGMLPDILREDVCGWSSSLSFGISSSRLLIPLALGARVVILGDEEMRDLGEFSKAVERQGITSIFVVPGFLRQWLYMDQSAINRLRRVRAIASGGGAFTSELLEALYCRFPHIKFINLYGSTELGTTATLKVLEPGKPSSIGRAVPNTQVYILGGDLNPVSPGTIGELYVSSPHLAREYLHRPDLTAERFLPCPFVREGRMCRTGDLARLLDTGDIEFIGRVDNQVKVRGFRIELEEVETVLQQHSQVAQAVVAVCGHGGDERLAAYVVSRPDTLITSDVLRYFLASRLPRHMIPAVFVFLKELPLTIGGKVDRSALPAPASARPILETAYAPPVDEIDLRLAAIWSQVLRIDTVGVHDNFFSLGGDSLAAVQLFFRISDAFGIDIMADEFCNEPTIAAMRRVLENREMRVALSVPRRASDQIG